MKCQQSAVLVGQASRAHMLPSAPPSSSEFNVHGPFPNQSGVAFLPSILLFRNLCGHVRGCIDSKKYQRKDVIRV